MEAAKLWGLTFGTSKQWRILGHNSTLVLQPLLPEQTFWNTTLVLQPLLPEQTFWNTTFSIATTSLSVLSVAIQRGVPAIERGCF